MRIEVANIAGVSLVADDSIPPDEVRIATGSRVYIFRFEGERITSAEFIPRPVVWTEGGWRQIGDSNGKENSH